ncbi:hypothetical protein ACLOJK_026131 [Asimina triloba]
MANKQKSEARKGADPRTVSILDEEIEGMVVAGVGEFVVGGGELLEALRGDGREIPCEFRVLRQHHSPAGHEAVDERFLTHFAPLPTQSGIDRQQQLEKEMERWRVCEKRDLEGCRRLAFGAEGFLAETFGILLLLRRFLLGFFYCRGRVLG